MLLKDAKVITGGLSRPSKMPGRSYSTPANRCITGAKLARVPDSVCSHCYADNRGNYAYPVVKKALENRYQKIMRAAHADARFGDYAGRRYREKYVNAMVVLINHYSPEHFRWHDSGDIQSPDYLELVAEICRKTPNTKHWLPTRELTILRRWIMAHGGIIPPNLTIRVSAHMIGETSSALADAPPGVVTSSVGAGEGLLCPALDQGNSCGDCRACWSRDVPNVDYRPH